MILECKLRRKNILDTYEAQIYKYLLNETAGQYRFPTDHIIPLKLQSLLLLLSSALSLFSNITPVSLISRALVISRCLQNFTSILWFTVHAFSLTLQHL